MSEELNKLRTKPGVDDKFRNPNGVAMKLHNFGRFDRSRSGEGLTHGGKGDKVVWDKYSENKTALAQAVSAIRAK